MTLGQLRREMPVNELKYWSAFHQNRNESSGAWRQELILAQIADLLYKSNFKGQSSPIDFIPGAKAPEPTNEIKPEELIAWAAVNNIKHEASRKRGQSKD